MTVDKKFCYGRRKVIRYASDGQPFEVWEKLVSRISDEVLDSVIYLYHTEADAHAGTQAGASGFLTAVPVPGEPTKAWVYAVTNNHVRDKAPIVRVNKTDGSTNIFPFEPDDWIPHPDHVTDLAAVNIDFKNIFDYKFRLILPDMHFVTREKIKEFNIGVGDDTLLVGRLINRDGVLKNVPSVRSGIIAQMPDADSLIPTEAGPQEAYLVETRSISGCSGSPIWVWVPSHRYFKGFEKMGGREWDRIQFLGIDCAHVVDYDPVLRFNPNTGKREETGDEIEFNTGMAIVIPAYKLQELLDCDELRAQRADDLKNQPKQPPVGKLDVAKNRKTRDVPIPPIKRGKFFDALGKATKRDK